MRWNTIILSLFISLIPISSYAAVYKWTDDDGNVHYSQTKPTNAQSKRMKMAPPPQQDQSTYKRPSLGKKDGADNQDNEQTSGDSGNQSDKKKSANKQDPGCKSARSTLKTLLSSGRVRQRDKDGNLSYMSDEQKNQRIKHEQDFIAKNCK